MPWSALTQQGLVDLTRPLRDEVLLRKAIAHPHKAFVDVEIVDNHMPPKTRDCGRLSAPPVLGFRRAIGIQSFDGPSTLEFGRLAMAGPYGPIGRLYLCTPPPPL